VAPTDDDPDRAAEGGDDVVVTQALRSLRRSALCCRRARLMIERQGAARVSAVGTESAPRGRELLDLRS
jgi:hypothetical protein